MSRSAMVLITAGLGLVFVGQVLLFLAVMAH